MTDFESPPPSESDLLEKHIMEVAEMNACTESLDRVCSNVLQSLGGTTMKLRPPVVRKEKLRVFLTIVTVSLAVVVAFFIVNHSATQNIAFAQVQEQVKQTKTVRYVEYMNETEARRQIQRARSMAEKTDQELAMVQQMLKDRPEQLEQFLKECPPGVEPVKWVQQRADAAKKRAEIAIESMERDLKSGAPIPARRVWIQGRFLQRVESDVRGRKLIDLFNAETGESATLYPDTKSFNLMKSQVSMEAQSGKKLLKEIKPLPDADLYSQITSLPVAELKSLPGKDIGGISAIGFEQTVPGGSHNTADIVRTYWIDTKTRLPVRIEADVLLDGKIVAGGYCADFVFDEVFEPELFNMTPPEGYTVTEGGFLSIGPAK